MKKTIIIGLMLILLSMNTLAYICIQENSSTNQTGNNRPCGAQIEETNNTAAPLAMIVPEGEPIKNPFTSLWQIIKNFLKGIGVNI